MPRELILLFGRTNLLPQPRLSILAPCQKPIIRQLWKRKKERLSQIQESRNLQCAHCQPNRRAQRQTRTSHRTGRSRAEDPMEPQEIHTPTLLSRLFLHQPHQRSPIFRHMLHSPLCHRHVKSLIDQNPQAKIRTSLNHSPPSQERKPSREIKYNHSQGHQPFKQKITQLVG